MQPIRAPGKRRKVERRAGFSLSLSLSLSLQISPPHHTVRMFSGNQRYNPRSQLERAKSLPQYHDNHSFRETRKSSRTWG
jgi:hypothetical protein